MVSLLASEVSCRPSLPGWGNYVVLLRLKNFTFTVPLSTQLYKWVPANLMLGVKSLRSRPGVSKNLCKGNKVGRECEK